jgi:hypothetical protein
LIAFLWLYGFDRVRREVHRVWIGIEDKFPRGILIDSHSSPFSRLLRSFSISLGRHTLCSALPGSVPPPPVAARRALPVKRLLLQHRPSNSAPHLPSVRTSMSSSHIVHRPGSSSPSRGPHRCTASPRLVAASLRIPAAQGTTPTTQAQFPAA